MAHPIEGLMSTTLENIKKMVDVDTIIGNPITTPSGVTIIPVSKLSYGFASGGSDFGKQQKDLFGGGSGAGISVIPQAFLVVNGTDVKLLQISANSSAADKAVNMIPEVIKIRWYENEKFILSVLVYAAACVDRIIFYAVSIAGGVRCGYLR